MITEKTPIFLENTLLGLNISSVSQENQELQSTIDVRKLILLNFCQEAK